MIVYFDSLFHCIFWFIILIHCLIYNTLFIKIRNKAPNKVSRKPSECSDINLIGSWLIHTTSKLHNHYVPYLADRFFILRNLLLSAQFQLTKTACFMLSQLILWITWNIISWFNNAYYIIRLVYRTRWMLETSIPHETLVFP